MGGLSRFMTQGAPPTVLHGREFPEISVQNSMDRFGPTGKVSKKRVHLAFEVDHFSRSDRLEFCLNGSRPISGRLSVVVVAVVLGFRDNLVPRVNALPTKKAQGRQMAEGGPKGRQPWLLLVIVVLRWFSQ